MPSSYNLQPTETPSGIATCTNCGAEGEPSAEAWCRQCGFYPALGSCIEIAPAEVETSEDEEETAPIPENLLQHLMQMPAWMWALIGCSLSGIVVAVAGRLLTGEGSFARMAWAFGQLGLALVVVMTAQLWALLIALKHDVKYGPFDFLGKPIAIWFPTFAELPATCARVGLALVGLSGMFGALVVVGGIPYHWLWEYEPAQKKNPNLLKEIVKNADELAKYSGESSSDSLEDAVSDFAGEVEDKDDKEAYLDSLAEDLRRSLTGKEEIDPRPESLNCLIVGYRVHTKGDNQGKLKTLLVASPVKQKLRIVAMVSEGFDQPVSEFDSQTVGDQLLEELRQIGRSEAVVRNPYTAEWVKPVLACNIKFASWLDGTQLLNPAFDRLVKDFRRR
ncbi:ATP dependent DNA ligase [Lignipirellula cremea]|uniref:DNA ligase (ATP) n=1 Tax=Lignipirellula cremea TaxID=2528010 RepID=A0A518DZP9_9BACT|nr:hypothetical protein [Lignipirellula cremea]QDU97318.1 hypothetical protein Pla8534_51640 [Lignipirellula cremea]